MFLDCGAYCAAESYGVPWACFGDALCMDFKCSEFCFTEHADCCFNDYWEIEFYRFGF